MTKPTGRPRGRPRKAPKPASAQSATPKRPPHRARKLLRDKPERFWLAFLQAALERTKGRISERALLITFAALRHGRPLMTRENLAAMRRGEPYLVAMDEAASRAQPHLSNSKRHKNAFHPPADDTARALRKLRDADPADPDRRWLACMVRSWIICLSGDRDEEWLARELAACAGEITHYETVMQPVLRRDIRATLFLDELLGQLEPPKK
ncbi:hypothetical protein AMST5_02162 [freshwater sediment metagenome]|uniref:Uncharacterized protein n=1 Tax=freshwater sediment metagenome TaxID=556182 RepID=A0AA48M290_9ZZZZ